MPSEGRGSYHVGTMNTHCAGWGIGLALMVAGVAAAEPARDASVWSAKAADHFLALDRPTADEYLDVITALSRTGDVERLRRVVARWEQRLAEIVDPEEEPSWLHATAYLTLAEGCARAGDEAGFARAMATADGIADRLEDDTKGMYARQKPQTIAFHDAEKARALVRALPEKRRAEKFIEVAWACAEMGNRDGTREALGSARAAAEKSLDDGGKQRTAAAAVKVLIVSGDLAAATDAAAKLPPGWRINAYARLVRVHHAAGRGGEAGAVLAWMADLVREAAPADRGLLANIFADSAAAIGRGAEALPLVRLAEQAPLPADTAGVDSFDPAGRAARLTQLAAAFASAGEFDACRRHLDEALKLRAARRAAKVAEAARRLAREGEAPEDGDILDARGEDGLPLRLTIGRVFDDTSLSQVAYAIARAGRTEQALELAAQVDPREKENASMWVARGAAAAGDVAAARRIADGIREKAQVVSTARWVGEALAWRKDRAAAEAWASSRPNDQAKLAAYLGAAEGMTATWFWEARLGF